MRVFYADDLVTNQRYKVVAFKKSVGIHCAVYLVEGAIASDSQIAELVNTFDTVVYPRDTTIFGDYYDFDKNGKVIFLLLDVIDGSGQSLSNGYVAGYFSSTDMSPNIPRSNKCDMMFIDTNPGFQDNHFNNNLIPTIAHEFEHMINFSHHREYGQITGMNAWIDEGLAVSAEYLYSKNQQTSRIGYFSNDSQGTIRAGNSFVLWNDAINDIPGRANFALDAQANYSSVYLFFQWLGLNSGLLASPENFSIYYDIILSRYPDYRAVVLAAARNFTDFNVKLSEKNIYLVDYNRAELYDSTNDEDQIYFDAWDILFSSWLCANVINTNDYKETYTDVETGTVTEIPTGLYGYQNILALSGISLKNSPITNSTYFLFPGEAVYTRVNAPVIARRTEHARGANYIGIDVQHGKVVEDLGILQEGDILISYNSSPIVRSPIMPVEVIVMGEFSPDGTVTRPQSIASHPSSTPAQPDSDAVYPVDVRDLPRLR
jgi:hypothetical protein